MDENQERIQLYELILANYPEMGDVEELCFYLGVKVDDLRGQTRKDKARSLVQYLADRGRLIDLRALLLNRSEGAYQEAFGAAAAKPLIVAKQSPRRSDREFARNPKQIFISHATADAEFAHRLADDLRRKDYTIWIAPESIPGGQWVSAINRGLAESGVMLLVLTPAALESPWVELETNVAIEDERAGKLKFIPVCLIKDRYDPIWHAYQWVMFDRDYDVAWRELLVRLDADSEKVITNRTTEQRPTPVNKIPPTERKISPKQAKELQVLAHETAAELGRQSGDDELREVYRRFNHHFGLGGYRQLPRRRFAEGLAFLTAWRDEVVATSIPDNATEVANYELREKTGIDLIRIPAGPFLYGDDKREIELPEYWIGRYPLTNAQYKRFVDATGHDAPKHWNGGNPPPDKLDHPVVYVNWHDAQAYADWAGLALPTEEEWEKAARGSDGRTWPWGGDPPTAEHGNYEYNVGDTTPVGDYSPRGDSPFGCADMSGNVWEWTATADEARRVLRGGSWGDDQDLARAVYRYDDLPYVRLVRVGCRVVRRPPSQAL